MKRLSNTKKEMFKVLGRKFCRGEKVLVSFRLPNELVKEFSRATNELQYTSQTELLATVMDQFIQWHREKRMESDTPK